MRFRFVIYGDYHTEENEDVEVAREEARLEIEERMKCIPNCTLDSLQTTEEVLHG